MNVIQNMINMYNTLPIDSTYRAVLKALLINLRLMNDASIYDTAEMTASSRTTIWRAVKQMGYKSYTEFHHALSQAVSQYSYYNRVDMGNPSPDLQVSIRKISDKLQYTLAAAEHVDAGYARQILAMLNQANRVGFYGFDGNRYLLSLQENLSMRGKETNLFMLYPAMLEDASSTGPDSLTFIHTLEYSETMDMEPVFSTLKKRGGKIILEHTGTESRYMRYADVCLNQLYTAPGKMDNIFTGIMSIALINEMYRGQFADA